jgi:hypothetical protein
MQNLKNVRMPQGNAAGRLGGLIFGGGALLYGVSNSLFNVEGGHRAIVFNRITGIKEDVRLAIAAEINSQHLFTWGHVLTGVRGRDSSYASMVRPSYHI